MKTIIAVLLATAFSLHVNAQEEFPLYQGSVPDSKINTVNELQERGADGRLRISKTTAPTLTVFRPEGVKPNGMAVIICPGGGYRYTSISHEGFDVAKEMAKWGITAFVLKYRLPDDSIMVDKSIGPLQDAQRAIQIVRERAGEWKLQKDKIGIMGFSAGGHLASTAGTHFTNTVIKNTRKTSLRPDFLILIYPVISFSDSLAHKGSRTSLIGESPSPELLNAYSNEKRITAKTPRSFLVHAKDDKTVRYQNSVLFYEKLQEFKIPSKIYLYEKGGHGFGMNNSTSDVKWMDLLREWLGIS
ncbi:MAG: alpha/beta hydrolase [Gemmatimonadaceae bacterium]|nr:alpha/beta hydrolase [Chitinophagaceae bacterium]